MVNFNIFGGKMNGMKVNGSYYMGGEKIGLWIGIFLVLNVMFGIGFEFVVLLEVVFEEDDGGGDGEE